MSFVSGFLYLLLLERGRLRNLSAGGRGMELLGSKRRKMGCGTTVNEVVFFSTLGWTVDIRRWRRTEGKD